MILLAREYRLLYNTSIILLTDNTYPIYDSAASALPIYCYRFIFDRQGAKDMLAQFLRHGVVLEQTAVAGYS